MLCGRDGTVLRAIIVSLQLKCGQDSVSIRVRMILPCFYDCALTTHSLHMYMVLERPDVVLPIVTADTVSSISLLFKDDNLSADRTRSAHVGSLLAGFARIAFP
jgi:hypothetical protein